MKTKLLLLLLLANFSSYAQANLVPDGGLESWQFNHPTFWSDVNISQAFDAIEGNYSARLKYTTQSPKINTQVPLKGGVNYTIKFKYQYVTSNFSGSHPISLNISKDGSATALSYSTFASNNSWTEVTTSFTPDLDLSYNLSISTFSFDGAEFEILIDDVKVYVEGTEKYTNIPDAEFEKALIAAGIDSGNVDGKVLTSNINNLRTLTVNTDLISDLTGIQDFTQLRNLTCSGKDYFHENGGGRGSGKLTKLDLSGNKELYNFTCSKNQLTSLDLSNNTKLNTLDVIGNKLTSLDLSQNTKLGRIYCSQNMIATLNVSHITSLNGLYVDSNKLTSLDLSKNIALNYLTCSSNQLKTINLKNGKNTLLTGNSVYLRNNPDLTCVAVDDVEYAKTSWTNVTTNSYFYPFECDAITLLDTAFEDKLITLGIDTDGKNGYVLNSSIAAITTLDVSNSSLTKLTGIEGFKALTNLNCSGNSIKRLNLSQNNSINTLNTSNNPSLKCIQVANVDAASKWNTTKDATTSFNLDCETFILIPDSKFEDKLISLGIDRDGKNGKVNTESIEAVTSLNLWSAQIKDLTGIEGFTALQTLDCSFNTIENLDLSKNTALKSLSAPYNKISTIDLSNNTLLEELSIYNNSLTALDVSANKALTSLTCNSNQIPALDISNNLSLKTLECSNNKIKTLDVKKNTALESLRAGASSLTSLDLTQNPALKILSVNSNDLKSLELSKNLELTKLNVSYNKMTALDLKANTKLTFLNIQSTDIVTLNTSSNTELEYLVAGANGSSKVLTNLDLTKNTKLIELNVWQSLIEKIDLSQNTALKMLQLESGKLTSINLSANTALEVALVGGNQLTTLDVSNNKLLQTLSLATNLITSLDVSKNTALTFLDCGNNSLTKLNLQNGNNSNFKTNTGIYFMGLDNRSGGTFYSSFKSNVNLNCIQVDDVAFSNTNWSTLKDDEANFNALDCGTSTMIPDLVFEQKLIDLGIDKDGKNGAVLNASINTITALDVSNSSISNLAGLQGFTALETLNISNNLIKKVDLSKNTSLKTLDASSNSALTCIKVADIAATEKWNVTKDPAATFSLDCEVYTLIPDPNFEDYLIARKIDRDGKNGKVKTESLVDVQYMNDVYNKGIKDLTGIQDFISLEQLDVSNNPLTTIDLSKNLALKYVNCGGNSLENINLSKNINLIKLTLGGSPLTTVDLSQNINLTSVDITNHKLKTLDLSHNTKLSSLNLSRGELVSLDLSKNTELETLYLYNNSIRSLDLSKNSKLTSASLSENKLVNLNIKNGANTKLGFSAVQNPDLTCIQVDDVAYANKNWTTSKDETATFSAAACPTVVPYTLIPDPKFEEKLISLKIDTDGLNGKVETMNIVYLTSLNISKSEITDLTGLEDFASLTSLDCSDNKLKEYDFRKTKSLKSLNISKNKLSYISIVNTLTNLNISHNEFASIDFSYSTNLTVLSASYNQLRDLDVSKNTKLKELDCAGNNMYNLNLKNGNNANMQNMIFGNFTENPNLLCIQVDDADFSTKNWIAKDATATYSSEACAPNFQYTLIPDPNFERILIQRGYDSGEIDGKVLTSNIQYVTSLSANDLTNKVTDLTGIEDFKSLQYLYAYHGAITKINVSKNLKLKHLEIDDNQITTLDLSKNIALETLICSTNKLTELDLSNNTALKSLSAASNLLTKIDISKNIELKEISLSSNMISSIDVTAHANLNSLSIANNLISSIDVSSNLALTSLNASFNSAMTSINVTKNTNLDYLNLKENQLTAVDVSKNSLLRFLDVSNNKIETIDVSKNPALTGLMVNSNQLTSLDLRNGKNDLLQTGYISFSLNPKLYCILVDNTQYSNQNWPYKKDNIATYNTECTGEITVPANNFTVETKSESCLGENNGEIRIVAKSAFDYVATINNKSYNFTNSALQLTSLTPGVYAIKITIPNMIFEQSFNVTIAKGATITGKSSISAKNVEVEITEGTAPFTVFVNGAEQFQTTDTNFSVSMETAGLVEVATAKACEGIFAKKVSSYELGTILAAYPNPTRGLIEIEIPTTKTEITIELYNFGGQLVSNGTYNIESGKALLNLEKLPSGIYAAKINLETPEYIKIIKK